MTIQERPNTIPMTFSFMQALANKSLERRCSCNSKEGDPCPTDKNGNIMWHTWRRYGVNGNLCAHDACVFVKRDRLCLNILDRNKSRFLREMRSADWQVYVDDLRYENMTRYDVLSMDATRDQLLVLERWIKRSVLAFAQQ